MIHVLNYQLAIFFNKSLDRPDKFFDSLNEAIGNLFDRMPQIIPLPNEVPPEIPRVTAANSSGVYSCNVAVNRMDFTIQVADSKFSESEAITDFIFKTRLIVKNIPSVYEIVRVGIIGNFFEIDRSSAINLSKKYSKKDLGNLHEFSIRYNKLSQDFGYVFNNVFSSSSAELNVKGINSNGVFIQKDVNNMPSENIMKRDDVTEIINKKMKEFTSDFIERNS